MRHSKITILFCIFIASALWASCADDGGSKGSPDGGDTDTLPEAICLDPGDGPYDLTFTDVTDVLAGGITLTGSNVTVADVNGDNWPDLAITKGQGAREETDEPLGYYHLFLNGGGGGFTDATWDSGLFTARDGTPGRATSFVLWADVDNDGDRDAFSVVYEDANNYADLLDHTSVFFNDGTGSFTIGPEQDFSSAAVDPMAAAAFLDYDRDGVLDVFTGHQYATYGSLSSTIQDSLYAGDGQGGFSDVTNDVGLTTASYGSTSAADGTNHKPTWGVTACDVDGDGWTDLMTSSYGRQLNQFFRNDAGQFENLTMTSGFASDDNEDFTDNMMYMCYCEYHPTVEACIDAPESPYDCSSYQNNWNIGMDDQPWRNGGNSGIAVCGDVDNDGDMDLLTVELAHSWAGSSTDRTELVMNDGFPETPLSRPGNDVTGMAREHSSIWNEGDMGAVMADLDNDGRLDIFVASSDYPGTTSLLWRQASDGTFEEITVSAGVQVFRSHGVALSDFDRDGDYDLIVGTSLMRWTASDNPPVPDDAYAYLLRNDSGQGANKIMLSLAGSGVAGGANRDAVGARITVTAGGNTYTREVQGGFGLFGNQQDEMIIIGIGAACTADEVTITWPNTAGDSVTYTDVLANYMVVIEEGADLTYESLEDHVN